MEGSSDSCESLDTVRQAIRAQRSGRAYLRMLRRNAGDDSTWLYLNKQAAHAGRVALCEAPDESPLGPITVSIRSDEIGSVIMWLVQEAKKN